MPHLADVSEGITHFPNAVGILLDTLWSRWVYFHLSTPRVSLEASLIRMAFLLYPVHTSITSPGVSVLSHMWLIFLFWWSSYFEEVTIKQVNNSGTSIYFLQSISAVISRQTIHRTDQRWQERVWINGDGEQKEISANSIFSSDRGQGGNLNGVLLGITHHSNTF